MPRAKKTDPLAATRQSLIARLHDWGDAAKWQEFFETYWHLLYSVAARAGLSDTEAQEVVQETCIAVAKNIARYDPKAGSFKAWLLQMCRWRITDQFRRRPKNRHQRNDDDTRRTATVDRIPAEQNIETMWDEEWQHHLLDAAFANLKRKVDAKHFQVFECLARKGWSAAQTAKSLAVNIAQVYLIKHRLKALLKKEIAVLDR